MPCYHVWNREEDEDGEYWRCQSCDAISDTKPEEPDYDLVEENINLCRENRYYGGS